MEKALGDLYVGVFGNDDEWRTGSSTPATAAATSPGASDPSPVPPVHRLRLCGSEELVRARPGDPGLRRWLPPEVRRRGPVGPHRLGRAGLSALAAAGLPPRRRRHRVRRAADRRTGTLLPVNLDLTDEHELLRRTVRDFAVERSGRSPRLDRGHRFPYELVKEMAELGLMGMTIPEEYGGAGAGTVLLRDRGGGADPRGLVRRDHDGRAPLARDAADLHVPEARSRSASGFPSWRPARSSRRSA